MKRKLLTVLSLAVAGGALVGCDTDETVSCTVATQAADCAGYVCVVADGEATGVCSATTCAPGFQLADDALTGGQTCVAITTTCAQLDCAPFACNAATNQCFTTCTDGEQCDDAAQCDDVADPAVCVEVTPDPYMYVAVVSRASGTAALDNQNPGPDLDAISVSAGGVETFATVVESSAQGAAGNRENTRPLSTHANAVLAKDTVVGGVCDLDAQPGYVAIGGEGGFIVVAFGREVATGDTITVYEVDSNYCSEATAERPDAYEVYITTDTAAARNPGSAANIRSTWCQVGSQGGNGGVFAQAFNSANCPM